MVHGNISFRHSGDRLLILQSSLNLFKEIPVQFWLLGNITGSQLHIKKIPVATRSTLFAYAEIWLTLMLMLKCRERKTLFHSWKKAQANMVKRKSKMHINVMYQGLQQNCSKIHSTHVPSNHLQLDCNNQNYPTGWYNNKTSYAVGD
jgi:hypothetical protein